MGVQVPPWAKKRLGEFRCSAVTDGVRNPGSFYSLFTLLLFGSSFPLAAGESVSGVESRTLLSLFFFFFAFLFLIVFFLLRWRDRDSSGPEFTPLIQDEPEEEDDEKESVADPVTGFPFEKKEKKGREINAEKLSRTGEPEKEGDLPFSSRQDEFHQERWNLPGFLSLPPFIKALPIPEGTFQPRTYNFISTPRDPAFFLDLETFGIEFLSTLERYFPDSRRILYLTDRQGEYTPVLGALGKLRISGEALHMEKPDPEALERLRSGKTVLFEDGCGVIYPLESEAGLLGALWIESGENLFDEEVLSRGWSEIRRFSTFLIQAKVYEQAVTDQETTLASGFRFHEDLVQAVARRRLWKKVPSLYLGKWNVAELPEEERRKQSGRIGIDLRNRRPPEFAFYRIATDVFAILGPELGSRELKEFFQEIQGIFQKSPLQLKGLGGSDLAFDLGSAREWFRRAGLALDESERRKGKQMVVYRDTVREITLVPENISEKRMVASGTGSNGS